MRRSPVAAIALLVVLSITAAVPAVASAASPNVWELPDGQTTAMGSDATTIIRVVADTTATANPGGGKVVAKLGTVAPFGGPVQLRVKAVKDLGSGVVAYQAYLPQRPNGALGWVRNDRVQALGTGWRVKIDLSDRQVKVLHDGKVAHAARVVVGAPATPTPMGEFFVAEEVQRPSKEFTGSWILPFAFSNVLDQFEGGPGRVAMHGRGGGSLSDPLGTARSHGCVRMNNRDVAWIATRVPEGTPVSVVA